MKLNNKALLTSAGIGAAIHILISICRGVVPFTILAGADVGLMTTLGLGANVLLCCGWIINLGIGFGYVYFASRESGPMQVGEGALGGALATAIAAVLGGLLTSCLLLVSAFALTQGNSDVATQAATGSIPAIAIAICGGLFGGAIVGAIGGLIGALTIGKPKTA